MACWPGSWAGFMIMGVALSPAVWAVVFPASAVGPKVGFCWKGFWVACSSLK